MRKLLFILNPVAGRKASQLTLYRQIELFSAEGWEVTVYPTRKQGDAERITLKRAADFDMVYCSGGDGTLSETASGLMRLGLAQPPVLGYIPSGTTNDFAQGMRVGGGLQYLRQCVRGGAPAPLDAGVFNSSYFVYLAAFGFLTQVGYTTPQSAKNALGRAAYFFEGARRLPEVRPYRMRITANGKTREGNFLFGAVTNSLSVAGLIRYDTDSVAFDDGQFEALFIEDPESPPTLTRIFVEAMNAHYSDPHVHLFKSKRIRVECGEEVPWCLDGENGGLHKKADIICLPRRLRLLRPLAGDKKGV
ncbi:MAG: YegS/Rv2252/BmrU family lipid kinase [Oscillospiraceae bacterium]|jgi:YegS/Rv2252/BmrU family lipid kinase|nr:YegS/Rv2252/BmrU family lipid kinase [Oscillospiraceae bacterium]